MAALAVGNQISDTNSIDIRNTRIRQSSVMLDIIKIYIEIKAYDQALAVAKRIPDPRNKPKAMRKIAIAYAEDGKNYQFVLNQIGDPKQKLEATITFHLEMAQKILGKQILYDFE